MGKVYSSTLNLVWPSSNEQLGCFDVQSHNKSRFGANFSI